jgi:hypothetical protein
VGVTGFGQRPIRLATPKEMGDSPMLLPESHTYSIWLDGARSCLLSSLPSHSADAVTGKGHRHHGRSPSGQKVNAGLPFISLVRPHHMKQFAGPMFLIAFLGTGILQLFAICGGIESWLDWLILPAVALALFLNCIPVVGTVLGVYGAVESWDWSWTTAILVFCWPWISFANILASSGIASIFCKKS